MRSKAQAEALITSRVILKSKREAAQAQPINTYGMRLVPNMTQFHYDQAAFAKRIGRNFGAPSRWELFKRLAETALPRHFEWHDWTRRAIEPLVPDVPAAQEPKLRVLRGYPGCSNCIAGHVRLLDPVTGRNTPVKELCENGTAPMVMTLSGPAQAGVPYVKGVAEVFEIELANGSKFCATAEHRVLALSANANHWFRVGELRTGQRLFSYEPAPPASNGEPGPSIRGPDEIYFQKTGAGCRLNYHPGFYSDDGLLHQARAACQAPAPSPDGVPGHSRFWCNGDGRVSRCKHNRAGLQLVLPSTSDCADRRNFFDIPGRCLPGPEMTAHAFREFQLCGQFHSKNTPSAPSLKPAPGFGHRRFVESGSGEIPANGLCEYSCPYRIAQSAIVSIRKTGVETFYDLEVPGPQHYFAEGTIHHNSAKTFNVTSFACLWWLMWPEESSVILVSTTIKMLRRRAWAEVRKVHYGTQGQRFGNFIDSRTIWQAQKGDDKHAVVAQAVEEGAVEKIVDNIKGTHTRRQLIIVDEATSVQRAILEACANLYSYPDEFVLVCMGNPWNRLDQFGLFCEPDAGWNSVSVDTGEWEAKPFDCCGGIKPYVVQFDAEKSPNVIKGKEVSRHLPTAEEVDAAKKATGSTAKYWQNMRGFWPPEGLIKTVFTESTLEKFNAINGRLEFVNNQYAVIGAADPAFGGGDRPVIRFGKLGLLAGGGYGVQALKPIELKVQPHDPKNPVTYQLAEQIQRQCSKVEVDPGKYMVCTPDCLGVDNGSGEGGLCDVVQRTWSPLVHRIQFQASASKEPVSLEDPRPANEVYWNKRVEMYFYANTALNSGQLKGIDTDTARELCSIEFDGSARRIKLQTKEEYRATHANQSPDYADCLVMLVEVARRKGFALKAVDQTAQLIREVEQDFQKSQEVYYEENLYQPEEAPLDPVETLL